MKKTLIGTTLLSFVVGNILGKKSALKDASVAYKKASHREELFEGLYRQMNEWFAQEQKGNTLVKYLEKNNYNRIAIYGMGDAANRVYDSVKESRIEVVYEADTARSFYSDAPLLTLEDEFPQVDLIIATDFFSFEGVKEKLEQKGKCDVKLLQDIIFGELDQLSV